MTFRAYIVDDEPLAVRRLERMLSETGRFTIAGTATDPVHAAEELSTERVDVLFLDIQMPGMNGFELLAKLREQPAVIFTTAYDRYALKAFEVNSIDYLLKPVEPQQLERAISKLDRLRGAPQHWLAKPELRAVLDELASSLRGAERQYLERVASRAGERVHLIEAGRITHFFSQDKLTFAVSGGRNWAVDFSILELEQRLDPHKFLRIHRSTLLNLDWVGEVDSWFSGRVLVRLKDERKTELTVARDRVRFLKERLGY